MDRLCDWCQAEEDLTLHRFPGTHFRSPSAAWLCPACSGSIGQRDRDEFWGGIGCFLIGLVGLIVAGVVKGVFFPSP